MQLHERQPHEPVVNRDGVTFVHIDGSAAGYIGFVQLDSIVIVFSGPSWLNGYHPWELHTLSRALSRSSRTRMGGESDGDQPRDTGLFAYYFPIHGCLLCARLTPG